jgi:hypothetical protein
VDVTFNNGENIGTAQKEQASSHTRPKAARRLRHDQAYIAGRDQGLHVGAF